MKTYIGDGAYADVDRFGNLVLTTQNGIQTTNRIVLEPQVLHALEEHLKSLRERAQQQQQQELER